MGPTYLHHWGCIGTTPCLALSGIQRIQIQILVLIYQALYPQSHLSGPTLSSVMMDLVPKQVEDITSSIILFRDLVQVREREPPAIENTQERQQLALLTSQSDSQINFRFPIPLP